jgi:hypothetical protein
VQGGALRRACAGAALAALEWSEGRAAPSLSGGGDVRGLLPPSKRRRRPGVSSPASSYAGERLRHHGPPSPSDQRPDAGRPWSSWRRRGRMRRQRPGPPPSRASSRSGRISFPVDQQWWRKDLLPCVLGVAVRSSTGGGPVRLDLGPRGVAAGGEGGGVARPGGPGGTGPARPRVRAGVFCRWPAWLDSAGACACKATGHARAG